ncbi:MAG: type IV toxin-antitoxin system AbiEi family antitoxin, partial [Actinobacteria bacterium]|nr:type IV toxin-antitoxin system AbiEi family antitoxin [Actinomycetota bacterium]
TPAVPMQTETGTMCVSTPESTAFDLVRYPSACGGWSNIATVLHELSERLEPGALGAVAQLRKTPEIQRLGYLLDRTGQRRLADPLRRVLSSKRYRPVLLAPDSPRVETDVVRPWRVIPNLEVEIDL